MILCRVADHHPVLSYAGTVFGYAGFGARKTNILIGINGFTYAFTFFVGVYFADRIGRRPMLIQGGLGTGLMLIIIGELVAVSALRYRADRRS